MRRTAMFLFILLVLPFSLTLPQKGYQRTSSDEDMVGELIKNPKKYQEMANKKDPAYLPLTGMVLLKNKCEELEKEKLSYKRKKLGNTSGSMITGNNSKTDSLLLVVINKVDNLASRLSNVEGRLSNIEDELAESDARMDSLARLVVSLGFSFEKSLETITESSNLQFLEKGKLMIFDAGFLALTSNDEVLNDFTRKMSSILDVDINPLWFDKYRKNQLDESAKKTIEKILKLVGSVDSSEPEVVWKYLVEDAEKNSGLIRQTFKKF